MRVAIYDHVEPPMPTQLPLRIHQTCSQSPAGVIFALLVPVALVAVLAAALVAVAQVALAPQASGLLQQHPMLGLEAIAAIAVLIYLVALPSKRLIDRLSATRVIDIAHGVVQVRESSQFRTRSWSVPLASYLGVVHHVRASLSGTRHEIILIHPQRHKSILLCVAPRTSQVEVDRVAMLLGHKQIPPSELYRFKGLWPRTLAQPLLDASHA